MDDSRWICDTCGQVIERPEHGWVEWLATGSGEARTERGLRIVHHALFSPLKPNKCQYDQDAEYSRSSIILDTHLSELLGPDGLMYLLSWLARNKLPRQEVVELIRRTHVPGYEFARQHLDAAIAEGVIAPDTIPGYLTQEQIKRVLEWVRDQGEEE